MSFCLFFYFILFIFLFFYCGCILPQGSFLKEKGLDGKTNKQTNKNTKKVLKKRRKRFLKVFKNPELCSSYLLIMTCCELNQKSTLHPLSLGSTKTFEEKNCSSSCCSLCFSFKNALNNHF